MAGVGERLVNPKEQGKRCAAIGAVAYFMQMTAQMQRRDSGQ